MVMLLAVMVKVGAGAGGRAWQSAGGRARRNARQVNTLFLAITETSGDPVQGCFGNGTAAENCVVKLQGGGKA
jgi:hypothetical protein